MAKGSMTKLQIHKNNNLILIIFWSNLSVKKTIQVFWQPEKRYLRACKSKLRFGKRKSNAKLSPATMETKFYWRFKRQLSLLAKIVRNN